jgi:hypothetical protein
MEDHPNTREIVEFGLSSIPSDQTVEVSIRDLVFVHQVLGEFIRFFHQPSHYSSLNSISQFLLDGSGYEVLAEAYYQKSRNMLPKGIEPLFEQGVFDHPAPPAYYGNTE